MVTNGIEAIAGMGDNLVSMAEAIRSMANMEIVKHVVKDGKLVVDQVIPMGPEHFTAASENIGLVLGFIAKEFAKIGEMDKSDSWFGLADGMVENGREAIAGMGQDLTAIVDSVIKIANSEFTTFAVQDGKLVPIGTKKMDGAILTAAAKNIGLVMNLLATQFAVVGTYLADKL
jgi:hypothetical protein